MCETDGPSRRDDLLGRLRGGLVVSCQALPGEPLHGPEHMTAIARSVIAGGAVGVRIEGVDDVRAVADAVDVPVIGLWKDGREGVYITPTLEHAVKVAEAGADIVALDATARPRRDRRSLAATVRALHDDAGVLVMADVSTFEEGIAAAESGADIVGTTLSGYIGYPTDAAEAQGPDLDLVSRLAGVLPVPLIAEGRIATPAQAGEAVARGAWAVVVGGAITRPGSITAGFVDGIERQRRGR